MAKLLYIFSLAFILACALNAQATIRIEIPLSERIDRPDNSEYLWIEIQTCADLPRNYHLSRIKWYRVEGESFHNPITDEQDLGLWVAPHTIYLSDYGLRNDWVIKHEMLHDLLQGGINPLSGEHDPIFKKCKVL